MFFIVPFPLFKLKMYLHGANVKLPVYIAKGEFGKIEKNEMIC